MEGGCGPPGLYAARSAREPAGKGYSGYSTQETDATPNIIEHVTDLYQDTRRYERAISLVRQLVKTHLGSDSRDDLTIEFMTELFCFA
ncbi:hypothetical protein MJO28_011954, partial [Puccinia striiformis f. sp. tritici]